MRRFPLTTRFLLWLVLPLCVSAIAAVQYLRQGLPADGARFEASGVSAPVSILRDQHGIVTIEARTDADAFFALGFAHAQDRMWQMELQRRIAQGRLSEVVGGLALSGDKLMRTLGLYDSARLAWPKLSAEAQASLVSYTAGVNAWLGTHPVLSPEFALLGVRPEPWSVLDSLAWVKVFALDLGGNLWSEVANVLASEYLNEDQLRDIIQLRPGDEGPASGLAQSMRPAGLEQFAALQDSLERVWKIGGPYLGSNGWVIAPRLMQSRTAALANDVHLDLSAPSPWYVARLKGDHLNVSGMTLVGLPIVIFGRNAQVAWGGTSLMADVQDLVIEQTNPARPDEYWHDGGWQPFITHTETIRVKADPPTWLHEPVRPVQLRVRRSHNGPIVSDVIPGVGQAVALRWVALDPADPSYEAFYRVNYARDWHTFKEAFRTYVAPALNLLYADVDGNIGSIAVGRIPVRSRGTGRFPVPGWNDEYCWIGAIPFDELPQQLNPPSGYIVSANNRIVGEDYPYLISRDWAPPDRAKRIAGLIQQRVASGKPLSLDYLGAMQADTLDAGAAKLMQRLRRMSVSADLREPMRYLAAWNGQMGRNSQGAAIFHVWMRHLRKDLFASNFKAAANGTRPASELDTLVVSQTTYEQIDSALNVPSRWCAHEADGGSNGCAVVLQKSLREAVQELRKLEGSDMRSWRWGDVQTSVYTHIPFSSVRPLAALFERRIANGGSQNTIDMARPVYHEPDGYLQTGGPTFRQIIQPGGSRPAHLIMNAPGQSGNVLSPHYADMLRPMRDVEYLDLARDDRLAASRTLITP